MSKKAHLLFADALGFSLVLQSLALLLSALALLLFLHLLSQRLLQMFVAV